MTTKRIFDLMLVTPALIILAPLFILIAIWIKIDSSGTIFFRQIRVGRYGKKFRIFKFRTMYIDTEKKGQLTVNNDPRITKSGKWLRHYKLDELPQLVNVLTGEMSLVGPRPEVPKYVALYPEKSRKLILSIPPGITDYASIEFRHENKILESSYDTEQTYVKKILPIKLKYYEQYAKNLSLQTDLKIIFYTFLALFSK